MKGAPEHCKTVIAMRAVFFIGLDALLLRLAGMPAPPHIFRQALTDGNPRSPKRGPLSFKSQKIQWIHPAHASGARLKNRRNTLRAHTSRFFSEADAG